MWKEWLQTVVKIGLEVGESVEDEDDIAIGTVDVVVSSIGSRHTGQLCTSIDGVVETRDDVEFATCEAVALQLFAMTFVLLVGLSEGIVEVVAVDA